MLTNCNGTVTIATGVQRAAIGTVLLSSTNPLEIVSNHFAPKNGLPLRQLQPGRIYFGLWHSNAAPSDSRGPGEEVVIALVDRVRLEIHCHGGLFAARQIVRHLSASGCTVVDWTEWLNRYGSDGQNRCKIAREAERALPRALTNRGALILVDQLAGALSRELQQIASSLGTRNTRQAVGRLRRLRTTAAIGCHLDRPWRLALVGRPNVGKSSLINALSGYERAIVYDQPGTTREPVTAITALDGWPIEFTDTAGVHDAGNDLEAEGIRRSLGVAAHADCQLLISDLTQPWGDADEALLREWPNALLVHNKADLATATANRPLGLIVSALTQQGMPDLTKSIVTHLVPDPPPVGAAILCSEQQVEQIDEVISLLESNAVEDARRLLNSMTLPTRDHAVEERLS